MKKTFLLFALSTITFLNGCKKDVVTSTPNNSINNTATVLTAQNTLNIESVKDLPSQELKKIAFRLLTPIEKYAAWLENVKLASINFTPQQNLVATEFINFLSPQVFDNPDRGQMASFNYNWIEKAKKVLTSDQIKAIAFQLFSTTDQKSNLK